MVQKRQALPLLSFQPIGIDFSWLPWSQCLKAVDLGPNILKRQRGFMLR